MQALQPMKIFQGMLFFAALSLPLASYAQNSGTGSEAANATAISHAEAAERELDSDDDSLPTSADMDAAMASSTVFGAKKADADAKAGDASDSADAASGAAAGGAASEDSGNRYLQAPPPQGGESGDQGNRYLAPPPPVQNDAGYDDRYNAPPPTMDGSAETRRQRREEAAARREEGAWANIVRLEIGLGWSAGASTYEDIYGADPAIPSFGPSAFLGLKFRLSPRVPLQLGIDASFTGQLWANNPTNSSYYGDFNSASMGMGCITLSAFPTRNVYLMLGIGMGGLQQDVEAKVTYRGEETDRLKLGATGLAALGFEFHIARPFRFGIELRAFGGVFDRDSFGAVGAYALLSFF